MYDERRYRKNSNPDIETCKKSFKKIEDDWKYLDKKNQKNSYKEQ